MKTEELLRYEAEYRAMQEALGTKLMRFDFPRLPKRIKFVGAIHPDRSQTLPLRELVDTSEPRFRQLNDSPHPKQ